jgi:hypothetical protein
MRSILLAATSLAAITIASQAFAEDDDYSIPPPAAAKPAQNQPQQAVHHHRKHVAASKPVVAAPPGPSAAEIADEEKIDALYKRVETLETQVQDGEKRASADHDAVASLGTKTAGWWNDTSINGRMFYDLTGINNANGVGIHQVKSTANGVSFDIKRFYVGVDHKFDDVFSANVTTDVNYQSTLGQTSVFLKKAYLQIKQSDALVVRVGSADMPWIPNSEDIYGYRYVENTLIDRVKFGNSADWGVHVMGKAWDGLVNYQVSLVAGSGYKKPLRSKQPDLEGRVGLNWNGVQLAVGGYDGTEGASDNGSAIHHHYTRFDALAAYSFRGVKVGVEYFNAHNHGLETAATTTHSTAYGFEPFASYQVTPQFTVFGRYDYVRPLSDTLADKQFHNSYFNVGVSYEPVKIVDFALVYKHDSGANGDFADQNGTIGGNPALGGGAFQAGNNGSYSEVGLFGQLRW